MTLTATSTLPEVARMVGETLRRQDRYVHAATPFFIEFPAGPLAIGDDLAIRPVESRVGKSRLLRLSATDSCRDRLAAFYHWNDRSSLESAVRIALHNRVLMTRIRLWSQTEGHSEKFEEFARDVRRRRNARRH